MGNEASLNSFVLVRDHGNLRFVSTYREQYQAVQAPELFYRAWDEFIELQVMDKETWITNALGRLPSLPWRYEIGVITGEHTVGGIVLGPDEDIHVGPCLSVFAQYVLPEYRNKGVSLACMRLAVTIAKHMKYKVLAYTHRVDDWRYETIYRRLS